MNITSKTLIISFFSNLFLSVFKVVIGFIGKSSALIADGVHSFSDLSTDVVAIFGNKYALKPADEKHPLGHGRIEYLICLIIAVIIMVLGFQIIYNSFNTKIVIPSFIVIVASLITIIIKFILSSYLISKGKKHKSAILIASGKESSADVISSIFVLISSILMQLADVSDVLKYSNLVATIIVGLFVIHTGFSILKENMSSILGEEEDEEKRTELLKIIEADENILSVDSFIVLKNGPHIQITGEVSMDQNMTLKEVHDIVDDLEKKIKQCDTRTKYINIHVNPN